MATFGGKFGTSPSEPGVAATSNTGCGVAGASVFNDGVIGEAKGAGSAGVRGVNRDHNFVRDSLAFHAEGERDLEAVAQRPIPRPACAILGLHEGVEGTDGHAIRGESNSGDGVWAVTSSSGKTGVFGMNSSRQSARQGGGNGVLGVSTVPKASGVFGAHNGNGGVGVAGFSAAGVGVQGGGKVAGEFNGPVHIHGDLQASGEITAPVHVRVGPETDPEDPPPQTVVLTINGRIDWKGPEIGSALVASSIHLQDLPFGVDGALIGTDNWFQAVQQALHYLDLQVKVALDVAAGATQRADRAQSSADRASEAANRPQPVPPPHLLTNRPSRITAAARPIRRNGHLY
jgi:hypothetical protein